MKLVTKHHLIEVSVVPSQCGTQGHVDRVVKCSCGMDERLVHGDREATNQVILYHRLSALEAVAGMKINIEWKAGS